MGRNSICEHRFCRRAMEITAIAMGHGWGIRNSLRSLPMTYYPGGNSSRQDACCHNGVRSVVGRASLAPLRGLCLTVASRWPRIRLGSEPTATFCCHRRGISLPLGRSKCHSSFFRPYLALGRSKLHPPCHPELSSLRGCGVEGSPEGRNNASPASSLRASGDSSTRSARSE